MYKDYFGIDYLRVTVHEDIGFCQSQYVRFFQNYLSSLIDNTHGSQGFRKMRSGLLGFRLKYDPSVKNKYCSFEFPGQACGAVPPDVFSEFLHFLEDHDIRYKITRVDFAIDNVGFNPDDVYDAIMENKIRSLTTRETLRIDYSPLQKQETGEKVGTKTVYFGSRQSERFLRVYDKRGYTRFEVEFKGKRSDLVGREVLLSSVSSWHTRILENVNDFIEFFTEWWRDFVSGVGRAFNKVYSAGEKVLQQKVDWLVNSVSRTFAEVVQLTNGKILDEMLREGVKKTARDERLLYYFGKQVA